MPYSLATLWHDRQRFLPGVLAVAFSSLLIALECGRELCMVIGSRMSDDALGAVDLLTPELRAALTERDAIVVDESDLDRLGIKGIGDTAEVSGKRVRVVGLTHGLKSLAGPYVFCHL